MRLTVLLTLGIVNIMLRIVPMAWLMRQPVGAGKARRPPDLYYELVILAIGRAADQWKFTCLEQALSGKWLLRRYQPAQLHIGVQKTKDGAFEAHAWLTINQRTVLGAEQQASFTPILIW